MKDGRMLSKYLKITVFKRSGSKTTNTFSEDNENTTHFGFQTIEKSEKTKKGKDFISFLIFILLQKVDKR